MEKHFTVSTYIYREDGAFLLLAHPKLKSLLPPGGHLEANETPEQGARREVLEECGLHIEFIQEENYWTRLPGVKSLCRPYLCLLEDIPAYKDKQAHQHIDLVFIAKTVENNPQAVSSEGLQLYWMNREQILALSRDQIFQETQEILLHLCDKFASKEQIATI